MSTTVSVEGGGAGCGGDGNGGLNGGGGGGDGDGDAAGGGQSPQVNLQFFLFLPLLQNFVCFVVVFFSHFFCAHASAHVEEGVQIPHVASQLFLTFFLLAHWRSFPAHFLPPHTSRHEEEPASARARPGDLESKEPSRLALVDAPPPGTQEMRRSSTCIAEGVRLGTLFCHTPHTRWAAGERGALLRLPPRTAPLHHRPVISLLA